MSPLKCIPKRRVLIWVIPGCGGPIRISGSSGMSHNSAGAETHYQHHALWICDEVRRQVSGAELHRAIQRWSPALLATMLAPMAPSASTPARMRSSTVASLAVMLADPPGAAPQGLLLRARDGSFCSWRRAKFFDPAIADDRFVFAISSFDCRMISASLAFARTVISRRSLVFGMIYEYVRFRFCVMVSFIHSANNPRGTSSAPRTRSRSFAKFSTT